ncbi:MAG: hypothetical protein A2734_01480 [Parcubacteria group bacterium RIFCSPHIGHO2_01_FULL_40_30]|nr:MAG: hypothetical protein A2734_01480 [Parcubacteria group bacterium RIFCSPHIGHO2_01_FULL_40_30]OHB19436.1 MAG: hypothetical protein A3D40_00740 [Parcubacteria group bacterium RIFCSPHIGHO2_02_FULL_40_12]OHB23464.1 MAG: hypothetical protein A3I22_01560 [Parcubacteria group bacterium RIFCSPLOWO2_02_FULL_40_12]OHB23929.1 MAG: hypothetical protein A3F96_01765 [Parcubacteria group bacterium RIFCSPLOWO2_12_FULL_40_10]
MDNLYHEIKAIITPDICNTEISDYWLKRLEEGGLTRDENPASHFCCYFLPYNPETKQIFIIHHKKSGLWLAPGGHIDKGESLIQTLNREIEEELGIKDRIENDIKPFLLTITPINNPVHPCKEHLDLWYRFPTDGNEFNIDPREFHQTRWCSIQEARGLITDPPNVQALDKTEELFNES